MNLLFSVSNGFPSNSGNHFPSLMSIRFRREDLKASEIMLFQASQVSVKLGTDPQESSIPLLSFQRAKTAGKSSNRKSWYASRNHLISIYISFLV
jgi:hypothetical protein